VAPVVLRGCFRRSRRLTRSASAELDASFGRQDHTTSPSAHILAGVASGWRALAVAVEQDTVSAVSYRAASAAHGKPALQRSRAPDAVAATASRPASRDDRETPLAADRGDLLIG